MSNNRKKPYKPKKHYVWWSVLGTLIQYGIPLSYIIWTYDIFLFKGNSLTGWGMIVIGIVLVLIKNKVVDLVVDYNKHLNETAKRGKWGFIFLAISLFLMLSQYWITSILIFFIILGVSNFVSLLVYAPYDKQKKNFIEMQDLIERKRLDSKLKGLSIEG
jgi:hypothetical protein